MVYPSGRVLTYSYGSTSGQSDRVSRVESYIDDDGTSHIIDYTFLGAGTFVESDRPQPSLKWSIITDQGGTDPNTGDIYRGLDRFGRVTDNQWFGYGTGSNVDVDRIRYGYDRAGNRIWRENPVATSFSKEFDEIYSYDALHRLKDMARGRLNTAKTALTSTTFAQCWTLDSTGNWQGFREDDTGDGTWDLIQARTANDVNEISAIANSVGASWVQPAYSPAGNMTTMPQPNDPTKGYTATYDSWNRLVTIVDTPTSNTVSEYAYDGAKRQIRQKNHEAGTLTETRHLYYTNPTTWRCLEERLGATPDSASPDRQFVWGLRYIDDCVLRDRVITSLSSGDAQNPLGDRIWAYQDANWNITAIASINGDVVERYAYYAFGVPTFLSPSYTTRVSSSHSWETLYCGYHHEAQSGLFHIRNRNYLATLGVWIGRDAAGYTDGLSLYLAWFVPNATDPFGLAVWSQQRVDVDLPASIICQCGNPHESSYTASIGIGIQSPTTTPLARTLAKLPKSVLSATGLSASISVTCTLQCGLPGKGPGEQEKQCVLVILWEQSAEWVPEVWTCSPLQGHCYVMYGGFWDTKYRNIRIATMSKIVRDTTKCCL
jgi:hypothetical protein